MFSRYDAALLAATRTAYTKPLSSQLGGFSFLVRALWLPRYSAHRRSPSLAVWMYEAPSLEFTAGAALEACREGGPHGPPSARASPAGAHDQ